MDTPEDSSEWDLYARISSLLSTGDLADVKFHVGNPPTVLACHRLILASGSAVFRAMFYGKIPEKDNIVIPDATPLAFKLLLKFLYTDTISLKTETEAFETGYAAKKYLIWKLHELCETYLISRFRLSHGNVCSTYERADLLGMQKLKEKCKHYISRHFQQIFHSENFPPVSKSTVMDILCLDTLHINSEKEIVEFLCTWGLRQYNEGDKNSNIDLKSLLHDLLCNVRFLLLSASEFNELVEKYDFLEASEQMSILLNIGLPKMDSFKTMPFEFSKSLIQRSITCCSKIEIPASYRYNFTSQSFTLLKEKKNVQIDVQSGQLTVLGITVAFMPIVAYSKDHRELHVKTVLQIDSSNTSSEATVFVQPKADNADIRQVFLDEPIVISTGESAQLTITVSGEGILIPCLLQDSVSITEKETSVLLSVLHDSKCRNSFALKELLCTFK